MNEEYLYEHSSQKRNKMVNASEGKGELALIIVRKSLM